MRRKPTPGGPYPAELFFEPGEIERICEDALRASGLLPPEPRPVRVERFLEKHFAGCTIHYEDQGPRILGSTAFLPDGKVRAVCVSKTLAEDPGVAAQRRVRSTLAHEAGHGLLHGCLFIEDGQMYLLAEPIQKERRILCRDEDIAPEGGGVSWTRWWEVQANKAIGGLLLPKALVALAVQPFAQPETPFGGLLLNETLRDTAVKEVARCFDVSHAVARIRLEKLFPIDAFSSLQ